MMDERTDRSAAPEPRDQRLRFELIFASIWLAFGLFLLPALIFWVGILLLGPYGDGVGAGVGTFYGDFFSDLATGELRAWALALGPLILITLLRVIFLIPRRVRPDEPPAPTAERPHITRADQRRVEPSVGSE